MWTLLRLKVQAELAPMQQKGKKSLTNMQHLYRRELATKRDTMVQQQAQSIIANNNSCYWDWNDSWAKTFR